LHGNFCTFGIDVATKVFDETPASAPNQSPSKRMDARQAEKSARVVGIATARL